MKVTVTGATGLIGSRLVAMLRDRGDDVIVLSRSPERAREALGVEARRWDASAEPAPVDALASRDGVVHLAGENIAQRWSEQAKRTIRESRETGTRNLVAGMGAADAPPRTLISASAVGYYGHRGTEVLDETAEPGGDFLAQVCVAWEREAAAATALGTRVVRLRAGVVLDSHGGALAKMLPFFRAGVGGPVAGGHQYMAWIHAEDLCRMYLAALDGEAWEGPVNASAPDPVTNREFSKRLGSAIHRPAIAPVPGFAVRALYGDMAEIVTEGQRAVPKRALELGFSHQHPDLDEALRSALA
jgi:uncharacterized protein (TIGR01777 family)